MLIMLAAFLVFAFLWPMARLRLRSGQWGIVSQRGADPCQRVVGVLLGGWLLAVAGWAALLQLLPRATLGVGAPFPRLGWTLMSAGLALVVVAQAQMGASWRIGIDDRPTALVDRGIFAVVRNPIFAGMLLSLAGVVALAPSVAAAMAWLAMAQLTVVQVRLEEQHLLALHGDPYAHYLRRVGRFVPGLT
jgi:protein-S-isoprenylcysteine O-methyltransferase Ste14